MISFSYTIIIPLILFASFLLIGLAGGRMKPIISGILGTISVFIATVLSYVTAYFYFFEQEKTFDAYTRVIPYSTLWIKFTDTLYIDMGILLDPLSVMMLIVISTVSLMVHIYSLGYMKGDSGFSRYYSFLSLFTFSMIALVISTNIFQTYIFWELVGASSYLLIGYFYQKPEAVAASKKAFIITRFADLGFLLGILLLSNLTGTFDFINLTNSNGPGILEGFTAPFLGLSLMTWALILIFIGCSGKSAMFPLHIWLPDAMEGPTPVSALIHAATMVVAGVFLIARLFPLYFLYAPGVLELIAYVGAFTSLFAAVIACTQTDIKRILAFSTISQIGLMMLALGVSQFNGERGLGYMSSMFHLFNHAMFKALLFLGAGSIIHAVHNMGGLRKYMPVTHITFLIACLAIAGIPPFSGFFSKDEILVAVSESNNFLFIVMMIISCLTAFYMFRLYFVVFWNNDNNYSDKPHESPAVMLLPLIILAVASVFTGFIPFSQFVTSDEIPFATHVHWNIALPAIGVAFAGIITAFVFYKKESALPQNISDSLGGFYRTVYRKFYIDEIYIFITKKVIFNLISAPIAWFDRHVIDNTMNGIARVTNFVSEEIKGFQSGQLQQYAYVMVSGMIIIVALALYILNK
ncbi:MAG TPA: NADH-quinone oxidoreductase subunit L [Ignavibacteria bacterium]|nr:NADH-quinone oxidoreductase subunit L [Ignavibacteria bacterium]